MSTETIVPSHVTVPFGNTSNTVEVIAEPTSTPGLVVTPALGAEGFSGGFGLTHAASGLAIPIDMFGADVYAARRIADALGKLGIDWTLGKDELTETIRGRSAEIRQTIIGARWTYEDTDEDADEVKEAGPLQPGHYPRNAGEATAAAMLAAMTRGALQRNRDMHELSGYKRGDDEGQRRFLDNTHALLSDYGMIATLRALAQVDRAVADAVAQEIWIAYDAGDSIGEELAVWGEEYGIPCPEQPSEHLRKPAEPTPAPTDQAAADTATSAG